MIGKRKFYFVRTAMSIPRRSALDIARAPQTLLTTNTSLCAEESASKIALSIANCAATKPNIPIPVVIHETTSIELVNRANS